MKGRMEVGPDQPLGSAAVGVVAGEAATGLAREPSMTGQLLRLAVTAQTERVTIVLEKLIVVRLVGLMTGHTLAIGKGLMLARILFFGKGLMTAETAFRYGPAQQALLLRGMGAVAGETLAFLNRLMLYPLTEALFGLFMTGITEISTLPLQQPLEFGDMGTVALGALALCHRFMDNFAAELLLEMTVKTSLHGPGRVLGKQKQACRQQESTSHLHRFSSP